MASWHEAGGTYSEGRRHGMAGPQNRRAFPAWTLQDVFCSCSASGPEQPMQQPEQNAATEWLPADGLPPLQHPNSRCSRPNNWSSSPNSRCRSPNRPWRSLCSPSRPSRPFPSYPHRRHQLPAALRHPRTHRAQLRSCCRTYSPSSSTLRIRRCPFGVRGHFNLRAHRGRPISSPSRRPHPRSSPG